MNRRYLPATIILGILLIMAITNPGEEHFKNYIKAELIERNFTEADLENKLVLSKTFNYVFFSGYDFKVSDRGVPIQGKYLGAFGFFFSLSGFTLDGSQ